MTKKKMDWGPDVTDAFTKQQGTPSFCREGKGDGGEGGREGGRVDERGLHKVKLTLCLISHVLSWSLVAAKSSSPSSGSNG